MLGRRTLARIKKNMLGQKRKNKVDKKDDITIVFFFLFLFSRLYYSAFHHKKNVRLWSIMEVPNIFWGKRKFPALKKETGLYNLPYISRQRKINTQHYRQI
jgi:hypothetical protein